MIIGTTGVGSLPGTDVSDAVTMPFTEDLQIPYLAELPARGAGADMVGRTAARLVDMFTEIQPSAWRLTRRPGVDLRRANDFWSWDLDALERAADGYRGPLKVALAGPWTLAAAIELPSGHRVLTDDGATRDLQASLAEGTNTLLAEISRRVPGAEPVLQLDEPALTSVLQGTLPTASGFGRIDAAGTHEIGSALQRFIQQISSQVVVHSCAAQVPFALLRSAGVAAVLFDAAQLRESSYDDLGEAVDQGLSLYAGVVPTDARPTPTRIDQWAERAREIASIAGIGAAQIESRLGITTACGLASSTWQDALACTRAVQAVSTKVRDSPEVADG